MLARRYTTTTNGNRDHSFGGLLREATLNGPVFLLIGSLLVGMATGERGQQLGDEIGRCSPVTAASAWCPRPAGQCTDRRSVLLLFLTLFAARIGKL